VSSPKGRAVHAHPLRLPRSSRTAGSENLDARVFPRDEWIRKSVMWQSLLSPMSVSPPAARIPGARIEAESAWLPCTASHSSIHSRSSRSAFRVRVLGAVLPEKTIEVNPIDVRARADRPTIRPNRLGSSRTGCGAGRAFELIVRTRCSRSACLSCSGAVAQPVFSAETHASFERRFGVYLMSGNTRFAMVRPSGAGVAGSGEPRKAANIQRYIGFHLTC